MSMPTPVTKSSQIAGERVEQEADISVKGRERAVLFDVVQMAGIGTQPGVDNFFKGLVAIDGGPVRVFPDCAAGKHERQHHCAHTHRAHRRLLELAAEEKHQRRAEGGKAAG